MWRAGREERQGCNVGRWQRCASGGSEHAPWGDSNVDPSAALLRSPDVCAGPEVHRTFAVQNLESLFKVVKRESIWKVAGVHVPTKPSYLLADPKDRVD